MGRGGRRVKRSSVLDAAAAGRLALPGHAEHLDTVLAALNR